jgi:hypothetical protein
MGNDNFVKVFDVLDSGFKDWTFSAIGLIFCAIGIAIFFFPKIIRAIDIPYLDFKSRWGEVFSLLFLCFAILWTVIAFSGTDFGHQRHQALVRENKCIVVEGPVENFIPMPFPGHAGESFSVSGVQFKYSDYAVTDGFNNTSSHGGPINKESYVRICYDPGGNQILRLEIRDFKGEAKDYSKGDSFFPKPDDLEKINNISHEIRLPWCSDLFVILYFVDFIALLYLFLPYLRTYFRLKTQSVNDSVFPNAIEGKES